jgi:hypothetical protein
MTLQKSVTYLRESRQQNLVERTPRFLSVRMWDTMFWGREWWCWYHLSFLFSSNGNRSWRIIIPEHFSGFLVYHCYIGPSIQTSGGTTLCNLALTRVDYRQQISIHCIAVNALMLVMYIFKSSNISNAAKNLSITISPQKVKVSTFQNRL